MTSTVSCDHSDGCSSATEVELIVSWDSGPDSCSRIKAYNFLVVLNSGGPILGTCALILVSLPSK